MHRQTIAANQAAMIPDVCQMPEQRRPLRQHVHGQPFLFESLLQFVVVGPFLHRPHWTGIGRNRHVPGKSCFTRFRQQIFLAGELPSQPLKNKLLIRLSISEFQLVRFQLSLRR